MPVGNGGVGPLDRAAGGWYGGEPGFGEETDLADERRGSPAARGASAVADWAGKEHHAMPRKPIVLIIGDSIAIGYTPFVADALAGEANVVHHEGNGGDSGNVLAKLDAWLAALGESAAVIHVNCGLHDIKINRQSGGHQVEIGEYEANLRAILSRLARSGAKLMWATTTPVIEDRHRSAKDFDRLNKDVDACNVVARRVMGESGVPMNDLHAAAAGCDLTSILSGDGVHFTEDGYRMLAGVVAERIREVLE